MERVPGAVWARVAAYAGPHAATAAACASRAWRSALLSDAAIVALIRARFPWQPLTPAPPSHALLLRVLCAIDGSYGSEEADGERRFHSLILADGHYLWLTRTAPAADPRAEVIGVQEGSYVCVASDARDVRVELRGAGAERSVVRVARLEPDGHSTLALGTAVLHEEDRAARRAYYTAHDDDVNAPAAERARHRRRRRYWLERAAHEALHGAVPTHVPARAALSAEKRTLYALMVAHLQSEGLQSVARALQDATGVSTAGLAVAQPLAQLVQLALTRPAAASTLSSSLHTSRAAPAPRPHHTERSAGLDLDASSGAPATRPSPGYATRFVTTHKSGVRCARFSPDGRLVATGSADTSVKLLDASRMAAFAGAKDGPADDATPAPAPGAGAGAGAGRPVLRTFYDHSQAVNDLAFHPFAPILASASRDASIKFFEFAQPAKRASRYIQDTHAVRSIAFHPCGDFVLAGTEHYMIRLYDVATFQAYVAAAHDEHHLSAVTQVRYAPDGRFYASSGKDGAVKVWDATTMRLVRHLPAPHAGLPVSSVQVSRSGKYLLTGGLDSACRLWDVGTGRQVLAYVGATQTKNRVQTVFTVDEEFVVSADETSNTALMWDARTAELVQRLPGHTGLVRAIAASDTDGALITCSDDHRARFWTSEALHQSLMSA